MNICSMDPACIIHLCTKYPCIAPVSANANSKIEYGTAGFRAESSKIHGVVVRAAMLTSVKLILNGWSEGEKSSSRCSHGEIDVMGIMITASHNSSRDNGLKIIEGDGSMLDEEWEEIFEKICNTDNGEEVLQMMKDVIDQKRNEARVVMNKSSESVIMIGRDTRVSGVELESIVAEGASICGNRVAKVGMVTTPMLHYVVHSMSKTHRTEARGFCRYDNLRKDISSFEKGGWSDPLYYLEEYFCRLSEGYSELINKRRKASEFQESMDEKCEECKQILIDCAHGVGALAIKYLAARIDSKAISLIISNDSNTVSQKTSSLESYHMLSNCNIFDDSNLNHRCGADFVQKERTVPDGFSLDVVSSATTHYCSVDGDADRIVFFTPTSKFEGESRSIVLYDGDRISILAAVFLSEMLSPLENFFKKKGITFSVGIIQTAYANGASTLYIRDVLRLPVVKTKTGVKHLHKASLQFDISIYFEANGHGTIRFSENAIATLYSEYDILKKTMPNSRNTEDVVNLRCLSNLCSLYKLVNPSIGDALSILLFVDATLRLKGWTMQSWSNLYFDLPSKQVKVSVPDRRLIITNETEERIMSPEVLQNGIDDCIKRTAEKFKDICASDSIRCFVRPSGTENVVRVYVEASNMEVVEILCHRLSTVTFQIMNEFEDTQHPKLKGPL